MMLEARETIKNIRRKTTLDEADLATLTALHEQATVVNNEAQNPELVRKMWVAVEGWSVGAVASRFDRLPETVQAVIGEARDGLFLPDHALQILDAIRADAESQEAAAEELQGMLDEQSKLAAMIEFAEALADWMDVAVGGAQ